MKRPVIRYALLFAIFLACGLAMILRADNLSKFDSEARIRSGVAGDLLQGHSRGRQGLIGSLYYAPLPTLAALPFYRLPGRFGGAGALLVTGVLCASAFATAATFWFRRNGAPKFLSAAAGAVLFLSPLIQARSVAGSSSLLFALLLFAMTGFLLHWLATRHIRSLAYLSVCLMLLVITKYQAALLVPAVMLIVLGALLLRFRPRHYAEGTLVVMLAPAVYAAILWIAANWLIMGNPWFFTRGIVSAVSLLEGLDLPITIGAALAAFLPWLAGRFNGKSKWTVSAAAAVLAAGLFWLPAMDMSKDVDPAGLELRNAVAPELAARHSDDWIVVSGYRGYEMAGPAGLPENIQHTLSFYLEPILADTHERRAYLLTPKPEGADRWEDINLKFPGIFENGTQFTVLERSWEHWRLWRLVRLDPTDRQ